MIQLDELTDVIYEVDRGLAWITINRPERYNAFRNRTVDEMISCFSRAYSDDSVGVVALTGAGDKAFCAGGDTKQRAETGDYGPSVTGRGEIETLHNLIREIPKPVIAAVNGVAVGGGHVLHVVCDLTIAADSARFGQVGPRVGSFDPGYGTALLSRIVGEKRAREIWYLCELYDAETAERWGLVNKVVPAGDLRGEVRDWADKLLAKSPTALRFLKAAFNENSRPVTNQLGFAGLDVYLETDEAAEGARAFVEKRDPDFSRYRRS
jgi:2-ketocyclohexanecarboxyl-CoA hydrolase